MKAPARRRRQRDHSLRHGIPPPDGQPQGKGHTRNYKQLLTDEAMKNASSYAAFAIHATFLKDHRFGTNDTTQ